MTESSHLQATKQWMKQFIIAHNLCPFAHIPFQENRIRYALSEANSYEKLIPHLFKELLFLDESNPMDCETTLLVHPFCLENWETYWDFLGLVEEILEEESLAENFQIVGFHPGYLFEGEEAGDVSHFTNRSPYPMIHILRAESVEAAIDSHPNIDGIPLQNVSKLRELGTDRIQALFSQFQ